MLKSIIRKSTYSVLAVGSIALVFAASSVVANGDGGGTLEGKATPRTVTTMTNTKRKPSEWVQRDKRGRLVHTVERSRITGRYFVTAYEYDINGRPQPVDTKSISARKFRKIAIYYKCSNKTVIKTNLNGKPVKITVPGRASQGAIDDSCSGS